MPEPPQIEVQSLHVKIRAWIQDAYLKVNGIQCPWDGGEGRTLDRMLKSNPSWTYAQWIGMLRNYFDSEGVNGDRPRLWLPNISRWARGPLDKYGKVQERRASYIF